MSKIPKTPQTKGATDRLIPYIGPWIATVGPIAIALATFQE